MHFKFITLSVSVMIKGLRSRRPRLASKFPYFYHVRLFIFTFLTCHSAIIDSCNNLCFPYLSGGTRKNIWNDTFIENNPMGTIQYSQTLFPILFCLHNSFKIVNCKKCFRNYLLHHFRITCVYLLYMIFNIEIYCIRIIYFT